MRQKHIIVFGKPHGIVSIPEVGAVVFLNPMERTLLRLFVAHPEGLAASGLLEHWQELCCLYEQESRFDDKPLRDNALESLCAESRMVFYGNVSRIKKKFVDVLGARKASAYYIKRGKDGVYKTLAAPG